ncbi:MAG: DUF2510 domain-containing protein [Acidimicrobiales bacterium]
MSDPPPPTNPPPGWYPDPAGGTDHRWWDGRTWTDAVSDSIDPGVMVGGLSPASTSPIGQFGPWFSESFRLTMSRFGHFLPMILVFVLAISLPTSFAIWYALRDTVITLDPDNAVIDLDYGGSQGWLFAASASLPISIILSFLLKGAAIRQASAVNQGDPELWSESVMAVLKRGPRVVGYSLMRSVVYWSLLGLLAFSSVLGSGFIVMLPVVGAVLLFLWVRLAFVGTVAAIGDSEARPLAESWRLSGLQMWPLTGRMMVLALFAFNMILAAGILGSPFTAIAGGGTAPIETTAEVLRFNDLMGPNSSVFALGSVFNALGLGVNYVLVAVGTTLLYRNLGGAVSTVLPDPSDGRDAE